MTDLGQTTLLDIKGLRDMGPAFHRRLVEVCAEINAVPSYVAAVIAFESHFAPAIRNPVSGATGLIQFMPATAKRLGTTTDEIAAMTAVEQLDLVSRYFAAFKGKLRSVSDHYMAVLWPAAVGKPEGYALFSAPSKAYEQNAGLDRDKNGVVTKSDAARTVESFVVAAQARPVIEVDMTAPPADWSPLVPEWVAPAASNAAAWGALAGAALLLWMAAKKAPKARTA